MSFPVMIIFILYISLLLLSYSFVRSSAFVYVCLLPNNPNVFRASQAGDVSLNRVLPQRNPYAGKPQNNGTIFRVALF